MGDMSSAQSARRPGINVFDESKPMWRLLAVFLVPLMLSNLLQAATQTAGSIWVGRLLGTAALASISAVFPILFLLVSFLIGIASGSTVLIGQAFGAGDHHRVKKIAGTVLGAALYLGIAVAVIGVVISPTVLSWLGTPSNIVASADLYAKAIFLTCPVFFTYLVYTTFLRGTGDATTPFYALIVTTVVSICVTPLFILGVFGLPKLGVVSLAVASLIGNATSFGWLFWRLNAMNHPLRFDRETLSDMWVVDWKILGAVVKIGIPTGVQVIMVSLAEIAVLSFVNRYGSDATAAYGAVNQVASYVQFPAISIGIAASIFGAQCIGAKREDKLGSVIRSAVGLNYVIAGLLVLLCYAFAWFILGAFITSEHTLQIAHELLMITLWSYTVFGNSAVLSGIMRGSGDVIFPTLIGIFSIWGVEVPAAYILMHKFGIDGIWMGYPIAFCSGLVLQFCYYEFVWKHKTHERLV
jgi:putative MATE family efflux protein